MKAPLFDLWFLVTASDAIGAALAVVYLRRVRTRFSFFLAVFMGTVALEAVVASASLLMFWPDEVEVAPVFALTRSAGRAVKSVGVWVLVLYLLNFCEGLHNTIDGAARRRKDK
jgi:hypothetical protein